MELTEDQAAGLQRRASAFLTAYRPDKFEGDGGWSLLHDLCRAVTGDADGVHVDHPRASR